MSGREWETNEQKIARLRRDAQEKLTIGQQRLRAANGDKDKAGLALLSFHGALEDYLRAEVASRARDADDLNSLDIEKVNWPRLIPKAIDLGLLAEDDRTRVENVNAERNDIAHGLNVTWGMQNITLYAQQVAGWMGRPSYDYQRPGSAQRPADQQPVRQYPHYPAESALWYRSGCVMWLAFLFLNPVWAVLIWTDERQSRGVKTAVAVYYGLAVVGALAMAVMYGSFAAVELGRAAWPTAPARIEQPASPTRVPRPTAMPDGESPAAAAEPADAGGCALRWEPWADASELAGKNRYMVWEQLVAVRVQGSGMTADDFIAQVLERNPALKEDGYVFSAEREYLLPVCR